MKKKVRQVQKKFPYLPSKIEYLTVNEEHVKSDLSIEFHFNY